MTLKADLATDLVDLLNEEEFAESITYTAQGEEPKVLSAVVERLELEPATSAGLRYRERKIHVLVARHATRGLLAITEQYDRLTCRYRPADAADTDFRVTRILHQDDGGWRLEAVA